MKHYKSQWEEEDFFEEDSILFGIVIINFAANYPRLPNCLDYIFEPFIENSEDSPIYADNEKKIEKFFDSCN